MGKRGKDGKDPETGKIRHPKKRAFLAAFSIVGTIKRAAKLAGINRDTHLEWLHETGRDGDDYREAFEWARLDAGDEFEDEIIRRGIHGLERVKTHKGEPIFIWRMPNGEIVRPDTPGAKEVALVEHVYSDMHAIEIVRAHKPEMYRPPKDEEPEPPAPASQEQINKELGEKLNHNGNQRANDEPS